MIPLAALCGTGAGLGLMIIWAGWRGADPLRGRGSRRAGPAQRQRAWLRLAAAAAAALVTAAVTGWPAGALLAAAGAWALPRLLGRDRAAAARLARIEGVAAWAEQLRDTLSAAAGLEQAIAATAATAPAAVAAEIADLAAAIQAGQRPAAALRRLAAALDDPAGDLVAAALIQAAEHHARHLAALLSSLAAAAREQASMRMRVAAGRARIRTSARLITAISVAMAAALAVLDRGYLAPYHSAAGQGVLAGAGGLFAAAFGWLARIGAGDGLPQPVLARPGAAGERLPEEEAVP